MRIGIKGISGTYAIGICGIVEIDSFENQEHVVDNASYAYYEKKELFWTIYDQIILPTRERMNTDPDRTLRMLYIEDVSDRFVFHFNIDDYDETYYEVNGAADMQLEDVVSAFYEDFCSLKKALPDDEPLKDAITWDKTRIVDVPEDFQKRLPRDVFYSSWTISVSE